MVRRLAILPQTDSYRLPTKRVSSELPRAEMPGEIVPPSTLRTIVLRYVTGGKLATGRRVLELGCGPGLGLAYLHEKGAAMVVGADRSFELLQIARLRCGPDVSLVQCDAARLPFREAAFDVCLLFELLMYLAEPIVVLCECRRATGDGGCLLVTLPNARVTGVGSTDAVKHYSASEVTCFAEAAGFGVQTAGAFPILHGIERRRHSKSISGWAYCCARRCLDFLEEWGFPKGLRSRLTDPAMRALRRHPRLPSRVEISHEALVLHGDGKDGGPWGRPEACRVIYVWADSVGRTGPMSSVGGPSV
jgi:SAM-dependent methyltransferase